jgi:hypothetical protein
LIIGLLVGCDPVIDRPNEDSGSGQGAPCPSRIIPAEDCETPGIICPDTAGSLTCECRGRVWICMERDGG